MITLVYGAHSITLPGPELGNVESKTLGIKTHTSMSGIPYTYIRAGTADHSLTFPNLNATQVAALRSWYATYNGEVVTYTDGIGAIRYIKLMNRELTFTQLKAEHYTTTLQFKETS